jgi:uncharacterized protein (TIGR00369 family)
MSPFEFAQSKFDAQPYTQDLGAELLEASPGLVVVALDLAPRHMQQHGVVHGGVLSAMADIALAFAGGLAMDSDAMTSEFKINYLRPARGPGLIARATTLGATARQAVVQAKIYSGEDLCCVAQGTIIKV